ncbi:GNAT family N-acetyltransferase [Acidianus infernus]|uniref:GNAT family N-acetyltransferase n=1 Tax=Acidianus infernus TaxID=12915 RepID=A0A6A9QGM0_ACIIN|nr:GNAT family N-acetyltransferase [Acidianus infernus]
MRGIGTSIVEKLIELGKEAGLKKIRFYTLPDNIPMIRISKKPSRSTYSTFP